MYPSDILIMNKQLSRLKIRRPHLVHRSLNLNAALRSLVLVGLAFVGGVGVMQQVVSADVSTSAADKYCKVTLGLVSNSKINACRDGIRGADCNDYAVTFDEEHANICRTASKANIPDDLTISPTPSPSPSATTTASSAADAAAYKQVILAACGKYQDDNAAALWCLYGGLGTNGTEGKPKTNQDCVTKAELKNSVKNQQACITGASAGQAYMAAQKANSSGAGNSNFLQDLLDQAGNLSQYTDMLHAGGQDAKVDLSKEADNNFGSYINGAGKQQKINVIPSGQANSPAILFFNGGGWHGNDGTSYCVAIGSPQKNCAPDGGGMGDYGAPGGGGATQRGYTVFDVTYRLGSSGVYYMFEDVMRGIQHVINNASMYNIDASKIAIFGDSAGGSLSMRAAASGKSGAKAAVGWSPPTNAYTGLFRSYKSLLIGIDHSTCAPTDLAGLTNFTDLLNGGSGNVAQYGQGLSSNDFSSLGISNSGADGGSMNPLSLLTEVLTAGQYAMQSGQNAEAISKQLESGGIQGLSGGIINLSSKKFGECIDNFNALSPALFASPMSPPSFLAGFESDDVVGPEQEYGMRDKLRSLGIRSEALVLPGDGNAEVGAFSPTKNHLGYDPRFVCPTLNFLDSIIQPDKGKTNCGTGVPETTETSGYSSIPDSLVSAIGSISGGAGQAAGGGGGGASDILGGLGGFSSIGGLLGNLGGFGGIGGGTNSGTGSSGGGTITDIPATTPNTGNGNVKNGPAPPVATTGVGQAGDFTGARGGGAFTESKRSGNCTVDYSRVTATAMRQASSSIVDVCNKELGYIEQLTSATYHMPPIQIMFIPDSYRDSLVTNSICAPKDQGGGGAIAFAMTKEGRLYVCSQRWSPTDTGVIVHEITHLTQSYAGSASSVSHASAPGWVTEGVADYVRTELGYDNPAEKYPTGATFGCNQNNYTAGYKCTDAFFRYISRAYNKPNLVKNMHNSANAGNYTDSLVTGGTGKSLSQLFNECLSAECKGGKS
jgi:acetyl esterase/lipase